MKKVIKFMSYAVVFVIVGLVMHGISFDLRCRSTQSTFTTVNETFPTNVQNAIDNIKNYTRAEDSTYLTFPEWYLVFNPQEYGIFIENNKPSSFPYFGSINQFWGGYCEMYGISKNHYPFNAGVHLMEVVIGSSFSAEYLGKGVWENTIGRATEWIGGSKTQEDIYAAKVAKEYGNFIPTRPWFEYPFGQKFIGLWSETDLFGANFIRKWERKIFLSLEYGIKTIYAGGMKLASRSVYGVADTEIYASVYNISDKVFATQPVRKVKDLGDDIYIVTLPHYQGFTDTAPILAAEGVEFIEIAGNDEILLTAVAPRNWTYNLTEGSLLFTMDMITSPSKRILVQAPTKHLSQIIRDLVAQNISIEHLYDY